MFSLYVDAQSCFQGVSVQSADKLSIRFMVNLLLLAAQPLKSLSMALPQDAPWPGSLVRTKLLEKKDKLLMGF